MDNSHTLLTWGSRDQDLQCIPRYHRLVVMFYRTNLYIHKRRLRTILKKVLIPIAKRYYPDLNAKKTELIAEYHDDPELVPFLGDVPLQFKFMMNESELETLREKEIAAAEAIAQIYPRRIGGYICRELLLSAIYKDCKEAQLVSFGDKAIDGYGEAFHELLAGNNVFAEPVINYHKKTFNDLPGNFPLVEKIFSSGHPLLSAQICSLAQFFDYGRLSPRPHTLETVARESGDPRYEQWKKTTIELFGVELLTHQTEFREPTEGFAPETEQPQQLAYSRPA